MMLSIGSLNMKRQQQAQLQTLQNRNENGIYTKRNRE